MKTYGEKYFLGLDMGTSSVGWAVTDEHYNLRRAKGKDLWGARLFDEANSSAERRGYRTNRRRSAREKARIGLLREMFAEEIDKVDPGFFARLDESKYWMEDRSEDNQQKYALFADKEYTDKEYFEAFPTIFHLRKALLDNANAPYDVRLVYLAILNMFKHRGNFLNEFLDSEDSDTDIMSAWNEFVENITLYSIEIPKDVDPKEVERILGEKGKSRSQIFEQLCAYTGVDKKSKKLYSLLLLMAGRSAKIIDIFGDEVVDEEHKSDAVCFRDSNYDEKEVTYREYLGDEYYELIVATKVIHDIGLLANIMKGQRYLTYARVEMYETHKADLALLKKVLKKYNAKAYNQMFRTMEDGNYSAYVGSVNSQSVVGKVRRNGGKGRSAEDLYKSIKKVLKNFPQDDPDVVEILRRVDAEIFLPKQLTSANGVIPNQVYVKELRKILSNAENYLPFLQEKDETGLSASDKIIMLFSFCIPYYVGPIGQQHVDKSGYNVWSVRKESGQITPWNFEKKIDVKKSSEKFIERMVRHCTYINDERTLPKSSLMYERFMVLNEINNIRINGEKISVELKQELYRELFGYGKKVSIKALDKFFKVRGIVSADADDYISGIDVEGGIKSSLSSWGKFYAVFGDDLKRDDVREMVERIIFWKTVYGDDKRFVRDCILENYPDKVDDEQIKRILGFKLDAWGNLSREFLELDGISKMDGQQRSILLALWETNDNLMTLLGEEYTYRSTMEARVNQAEKALSDWSIEDLDNLYLSAPVKRMVWQTIKIMNELVEVTGRTPDRVFVEMPREDGDKGVRTASRKKKLSDLYAALKSEGEAWKEEIDGLSEAELRSKKLYLYYVQMGKCMYSGESIDLDKLLHDNTAYDIDHIYPRHFIKDDSIENNLVLVKKQVNADKSDEYPLKESIRTSQHAYWKFLFEKGLITREKYNRLTRVTPFTEEEKAAFISRQLVETRQGTKAITQIIQSAFPDATVVFSKAGEVSDFRKKYDMIKIRSINDLHHAKDAYLNIVVGNTYFVKFTKSPLHFIREASKSKDKLYHYNMDKIFQEDVIRDGEVAWIGTGKKDESRESITLQTVKKTMSRNTVLVTRRTYVAHGGITAKDTVYGRQVAKEQGYIAMSSDPRLADVTKYGGRTSISNMCYCLVSYKVKGKEVLSLEALPIYLGNIDSISSEKIMKYLENVIMDDNKGKTISDIQIVRRCIKLGSLCKIDGHCYYLGGKTGNSIYLKNAQQLMVDKDWELYIKKIEKIAQVKEYETADWAIDSGASRDDNCSLYRYLKDKISTSFAKKKCSILDILVSGEECFANLPIGKQIYILLQIIAWFAPDKANVDLSEIGGSEHSGMCRINKKVSDLDELVLVCDSSCGLRTNCITFI